MSDTITINKKSYQIDELPGDIQELIRLYQEWDNDLTTSRKAVFKNEAALRTLGNEIEIRVAKHNSEK